MISFYNYVTLNTIEISRQICTILLLIQFFFYYKLQCKKNDINVNY